MGIHAVDRLFEQTQRYATHMGIAELNNAIAIECLGQFFRGESLLTDGQFAGTDEIAVKRDINHEDAQQKTNQIPIVLLRADHAAIEQSRHRAEGIDNLRDDNNAQQYEIDVEQIMVSGSKVGLTGQVKRLGHHQQTRHPPEKPLQKSAPPLPALVVPVDIKVGQCYENQKRYQYSSNHN